MGFQLGLAAENGFGRDFYAAYRESHPLDPGYSSRKHLYNLYHILNHANIFGAAMSPRHRA
ncbi:hypothetical protein BOW51_01570 [Solemya velesiana gill symbiont]|uniref:Fructosamine kinase family protein n=1 Tax=Solemya velesiana gill symbiont TaxID=1918948 RepID=A0A1T2KXQ8_9GAMM|nr:hypothetical protein BOW51_01570 [Solemya velesiana gill symbiont]